MLEGPDRRREPLRLGVDGRIVQNRSKGEVRLAKGSIVTLGNLPFTVDGRSRTGPRVRFALAADGITQEALRGALPRAVLGPLIGVAVRGSFDYRLRFDLDFERPDSVDFTADVIPHDLRLILGARGSTCSGSRDPSSRHPPAARRGRAPRAVGRESPLPPARRDRPAARLCGGHQRGRRLLPASRLQHRGGEELDRREPPGRRVPARRRHHHDAARAQSLPGAREDAVAEGAGGGARVDARASHRALEGPAARDLSQHHRVGPGVHGADEATQYYFGHGANRAARARRCSSPRGARAPRSGATASTPAASCSASRAPRCTSSDAR